MIHTTNDIVHAPFGNVFICIKHVFQLNRYKVVRAFLYQPPTPKTTNGERSIRADRRKIQKPSGGVRGAGKSMQSKQVEQLDNWKLTRSCVACPLWCEQRSHNSEKCESASVNCAHARKQKAPASIWDPTTN